MCIWNCFVQFHALWWITEKWLCLWWRKVNKNSFLSMGGREMDLHMGFCRAHERFWLSSLFFHFSSLYCQGDPDKPKWIRTFWYDPVSHVCDGIDPKISQPLDALVEMLCDDLHWIALFSPRTSSFLGVLHFCLWQWTIWKISSFVDIDSYVLLLMLP